MSKLSVLIIEDEENICNFIKTSLRPQGYKITTAGTAAEGLSIVNSGGCDLVLLDLGLPDADGLEIIREVRSWSSLPIIVISARTKEQEKVHALDAGADDYITKPFGTAELMARIRVMLRKPAVVKTTVYRLADLEVHVDTMKVYRAGEEIHLSGKEFALLRYMIQNAGIVLSRSRLEEHLWNYDYAGGSNVIDVYIRYLRKKIDSGHDKKLIHTVRGVGYVLKEEA